MAGQGWQRSSADAPHHPYVAQGREGLADHWWNVNAGTRALAELTRVCFINPFQVGRRGPQGLKPAFFLALNGTAEAVPYPKPIYETRSTYWSLIREESHCIPAKIPFRCAGCAAHSR